MGGSLGALWPTIQYSSTIVTSKRRIVLLTEQSLGGQMPGCHVVSQARQQIGGYKGVKGFANLQQSPGGQELCGQVHHQIGDNEVHRLLDSES